MQTAHEQVNPTMCRSLRSGGFLQRLPAAALADLEAIRPAAKYEEGHVLFGEKQESNGVFLVREGLVRLSINSSDGKRLSLRVARAGEILGLAAALSGTRCESTAETLSTAKITHISRGDFMAFLMRNPEVYKLVIEEVSRLYSMACEQLRTVGLSSSAPEKLARLLLDLSEGGQPTEHGTRFRFMLTHEQIGEFIGASRETVTRTLGTFKLRRLVALDGAVVTIPNRSALMELCA
ncbi:MAG: Crp/Fnr family transcriptional regulator [Acidobacteriaceae bacterium]|jgi:CRP/FNR family transcriptional regulator